MSSLERALFPHREVGALRVRGTRAACHLVRLHIAQRHVDLGNSGRQLAHRGTHSVSVRRGHIQNKQSCDRTHVVNHGHVHALAKTHGRPQHAHVPRKTSVHGRVMSPAPVRRNLHPRMNDWIPTRWACTSPSRPHKACRGHQRSRAACGYSS